MTILLVFVFSALLSANAVPSEFRFGSGPLNTSVQNERDAAIDRGTSWLVANQSTEGYWGNTNIKATAVAAIAVKGDRLILPPEEQSCIDRAVKWLNSTSCSNVLSYMSGYEYKLADEWRSVALLVLDTNRIEKAALYLGTDTNLISTVDIKDDIDDNELFAIWTNRRWLLLPQEAQPEAGFNISSDNPCVIFVTKTLGRVSPKDNLPRMISQLAVVWHDNPPRDWLRSSEKCWWLARAINRTTGGDLPLPPDKNGVIHTVNWRGIVAGRWISSQRIDNHGNGHWDNDPLKTAFALLLLNEM